MGFKVKINIIKNGAFLSPYSNDDEERLEKLSNGVYSVELKDMDARTLQQSKALHLWCRQIADALNANNLYMKGIFGSDIEWTIDLVKTQIVKATIKQIFNIDSTTKLKKREIDDLIDYITIALAKKEIACPEFPSRELWVEKQKLSN